MFSNMKRFAAFLLALVMVFSLLPTGFAPADAAEEPQELTQDAYAEADLIFEQLDAAEDGPDKKNKTSEETVEDAIEIVVSSESYVEDSLVRNGNSFTWWTDGGIHCVYSPHMREIESERTPETSCDEIVNEPIAVKGGSPSGNQVYLIGPYYGSDPTFTDQYKIEAKRVAEAMGDTDGYTLYSGKAATVDKVAEAVANGAVVFFDSHGTTDYENPYDEYDFVTGATSSYMCLTSTTGLTSEDYADGALYYSDGICINGATIANHMTKNSPGGILWMAICLGMATNTMCKPLREMGVEVVYGYSQSVTFDGDYLFEETFWDEMVEGATVAEAIATMKNKWGNWDWSDQIADYYYTTYYESGYSTISAARRDYAAFPVVVSDEDTWPGQRKGSSYGADSLQTVQSTYTLFTPCEHIWADATCTTASTCILCGRTNGKPLPHSDGNGDVLCDVCGTDMSVTPNTYVKVTETPDDWSGQYLIVYETGLLAFDGSLTTLDAPRNGVSVTITDNTITMENGVYFTIAAAEGGYTIQSASGYYIGNTGNSNKLLSSTTIAYTNTLSMGTDGSVLVKASGGAILRFNMATDQMRFRYYKTSSYTGQQPVALYRLVEHTHSYVGTVTTEPTCTASGVKTYTCSGCDDSYTVIIAALGHAYDNDADKDCNNCGEVREVGPIADANLTFLGTAGISFQDYIGMNIMFYNGTAANYDKFYAIAVQVDPDGNSVETLCNVVPYSYGGYDYTIFEHPVMSWSMTEQVTLTLYAEKDGVVYVGQSITTSVQALALEKLATYAAANNTVNCAALVDMLNYGAAVQVNQKHFVESLPSAGDYASYGTTTTPEFNATNSVTGSGIVGYGPSISMQAKVEFNVMYYGADLEGKTVKAFVDGKEVEVLYNYDAAPGWPIARVVIKANQMRSTFTIAVYDADGNIVSQVIETSIEACAKSHIGGANNDLVIALMRYGDSVSKVG